jgi:uncharacterized surface protein with fasciclin (FAS1) repeats
VKKTQRLASVGVAAAAAVSLAACSSGQQSANTGNANTGGNTATSMPSSSSSAPSSSSSSSAAAGVTTAGDVFGPACSQVPKSGPGSVQGMIDDPVGTAASHNPLVQTLVKESKKAGIVSTLNSTSKSYTVFAPTNKAFKALPSSAVQSLNKPANKQKLASLLEYHVLGQRYSKQQLEQKGTVHPLSGGTLKIGEKNGQMTVTDGSGQTSKVLCGNIPTANATVFVINNVMMKGSS